MDFMNNSDEIIQDILRESKGKHGLFCLNCLIMHSSFAELNQFMENNNIKIDENTKTKTGYLKSLAVFFYKAYNMNMYQNISNPQQQYKNSSSLMGDILLMDEKIRDHLSEFDFISKQELIDAFSDFCADLGISVFNTTRLLDYSLDLYLIKKTPRLRTETVYIRTGAEMDLINYEKTLDLIEKSSKLAMWQVFVTTPAGVYKIGLERLIKDMERLNIWLYVVDPLHKKISGITKGKKSKDYDSTLSESYIQRLPHAPVRAPSQVVKISSYSFKEHESYKPKSYYMYQLLPEEDYDKILELPREKKRYQEIFKTLLFIDKNSGLSFFSYSSDDKIDDNLVSGFLTAMDSFVSEIGGSSSLKEIDYKGFFIHAAYGEKIKLALFLSQPADQVLKEKLDYFLKEFEEKYQKQIDLFMKSGNASNFDNSKIIRMARKILDI